MREFAHINAMTIEEAVFFLREFKGKADPTGFFYITRGFCKDCQTEFSLKEIMFLTGLPKSRMMKSGSYTKSSVRCSSICETCVEFLC